MRFSCAQFPFLNVQITEPRVIYTQNGGTIVAERAKYAKFNYGYYETNNLEVIEAMLHHPGYNRDFYGPFSIDAVLDDSYKKELSKHLQSSPGDSVVPNLDAIAKQGAKVAAATALKVTEGPRLSETKPTEVVVLKASDIIARQTAEQKEHLADGADSRQ